MRGLATGGYAPYLRRFAGTLVVLVAGGVAVYTTWCADTLTPANSIQQGSWQAQSSGRVMTVLATSPPGNFVNLTTLS